MCISIIVYHKKKKCVCVWGDYLARISFVAVDWYVFQCCHHFLVNCLENGMEILEREKKKVKSTDVANISITV